MAWLVVGGGVTDRGGGVGVRIGRGGGVTDRGGGVGVFIG